MRTTVTLIALVCAHAAPAAAQTPGKPWAVWTKKEAEKILNDSPWGQTQTETDTSEMFFTPQGAPTAGAVNPPARDERGQLNQATDVKYRIRLFSARPIRQALARLILLDAKQPDPQLVERMRLFGEIPSNEKIVVAVTFDSNDQRFSRVAMQAFNSAITATLKNGTYLEAKGRRVFLEQYAPPGKEGFGALFIFPRNLPEGPFVTPESGDVRFVSEVARNIRLDMQFKVSDLVYNGKLEY
jgi:hypothetical protein